MECNGVIETKGRYAVLVMSILENAELSWKAKGLMTYLASRPDGWRFLEQDVINRSTDGRDAVRAGLKELQAHGYLLRSQARGEGRFEAAKWIVRNIDVSDVDASYVDGKGVDGKAPPLVNTNITNSKLTNSIDVYGASDENFETAWTRYPKRAGGNSKTKAFKAWKARIAQGYEPEEIIQGVGRYRTYVEAEGLIGTPMVKQAATFFGPDLHFTEEYAMPTKPKKKSNGFYEAINKTRNQPLGDFINGTSTRLD